MRPRSKKRKKFRDTIISTKLFAGWKSEKLWVGIKDSIHGISPQSAKKILHKNFYPLIAKPDKRYWSCGYCHAIAQVAAMVFQSQGIRVNVLMTKKDKKMLTNLKLSPANKAHYVLELQPGGAIFDPKEENPNPSNYTTKNGYKQNRLLSQWWYPSNRALRLFCVFVNHCCQTAVFTKQQRAEAAAFLAKLKIR